MINTQSGGGELRRGWFIAFEGGEGCGKSTQSALLANRIDGVLTREPGGTDIGIRLRTLLLDPATEQLAPRAEALLMAADRAQHMAQVVAPALAAGRMVVSDRSAFSSLAYQGFGRGMSLDEIRSISDWAADGIWPDVVLLLDVPAAKSAERLGTGLDRMERLGDEFHERVRRGFHSMADADPDRWVVIDGSGSKSAVESSVRAALRERLQLPL
ncbi:MAG: dTMP kinase [Actinomycetes bacterium]